MGKFIEIKIKFRKPNQEPIVNILLVNPDHVVSLHKNEMGMSVICTIDGKGFEVADDFHSVALLLQK